MELQEESSKIGALPTTTTRNLSSSSSAFVSANQSPFFSPRSPRSNELEQISSSKPSPISVCLGGGHLLSSDPSKTPEVLYEVQIEEPDVSPVPSSYTSNLDHATWGFRTHDPLSASNSISDGSSPPSYSERGSRYNSPTKERHWRRTKNHEKQLLFTRGSSLLSSTKRPRTCDVYVGYHGRKPTLLRFVNWLRAELEFQGISCIAADRARTRSTRSNEMLEKAMSKCSFGIVILTKKSFGNSYSIEELSNFLGKKNLIPIFFDLCSSDCIARDIIERRGEVWETHGGELWMLYGGEEREWKDALEGLMRMDDWKLEAHDGNWRDCILNTVILLATRLRRRSAVDRVNRWRERVEKEEFPFPRNGEFVGRKKELSELELLLFGDVHGDGEREYFELKPRHRRRSFPRRRDKARREEGTSTNDHHYTESSSKGKEPVIWKESEVAIEMRSVRASPRRESRSPRGRGKHGRKKRSINQVSRRGIACVSGESGIGKTELALEYAYRFAQRYKMVLWVGGESRYIRQSYLNLCSFLDIDCNVENHSLGKGKPKSFEKQEEVAIARVRRELMRDIPYLVIIDNLENEKDWWDRKFLVEILPCLGGETHFVITTRLPRVMNLEPMKLSFLSGVEAISLMKGVSSKDYPVAEIDALRAIEDRLERLTIGLAITGSILSELPISPSRLLDTVNRITLRDKIWSDREGAALKRNGFLMQLLEVCFSIFDHTDGPRSLATRMVHVCGWFAPQAIPIHLLSSAAQNIPDRQQPSLFWRKCLYALSCRCSKLRMRRSEADAASMLVRFGIARRSTRQSCLHFHELVKLYSRKRGAAKVAQAMMRSITLRGSVSEHPEHLWAACFLLFGFRNDPVVVETNPSELALLVNRVVLPLAIQTFITYSRCDAALELLHLCTNALEASADSMLARSDKWPDHNRCCCWAKKAKKSRHTYMWQELALLKATILETRTKLLIRGGQYEAGDDLIRKAIFIRTSIRGEHHPDTVSARETLTKLTRLFSQMSSIR